MKQVVKCLISNEINHILLIKRSDEDDHGGYWETPGGGVDEGETLAEACIREVKEESGCDITDVTFFETVQMPDSETNEIFEVHLFSAKLKEGSKANLKENPDHQYFSWIDLDKIKELTLKPIDTWTEDQFQRQIFKK